MEFLTIFQGDFHSVAKVRFLAQGGILFKVSPPEFFDMMGTVFAGKGFRGDFDHGEMGFLTERNKNRGPMDSASLCGGFQPQELTV
jgi:hypothetical protein